MDLTPYVETLRQELATAAQAGGEDARALAERLTAPLESAVRLTLLEALSDAAAEITRDLAPGSVDVRLRGGEPDFLVTPSHADQTSEVTPSSTLLSALAGAVEVAMGVRAPVPDTDSDADDGCHDGGTSRISLRVPDHLKSRIETAAGREGLSVNAWLVRAASAALEPERHRADRYNVARTGRHYTGWAR
jgi:hypothetical protein